MRYLANLVLLPFGFLVQSALSSTEAAEADRVTDLPGLAPEYAVNQFAGFVGIGEETDTWRRDIFYWFIESQSTTAATDPLLLWTNGGPGCSGLLGLLGENGPFRPLANGTLVPFEHSWTQVANVIFVEQPLFTGYSLSGLEEDSYTDDAINANRLVTFVRRWLERFPEYAERDLYLGGESYGGHYLPTTAAAIMDLNVDVAAGNREGPSLQQFRGLLVGNPYTNPAENNKGLMDAIWGHGVLPTPEYNEWSQLCKNGNDAHANCSWLPWAYWDRFVGDDDVDPYSLSAPVCSTGESSKAAAATEAAAPSALNGQPTHSHSEKEVVDGLKAQRRRLLEAMPARRQHPNGFLPTLPVHSTDSRRKPNNGYFTAATESKLARAPVATSPVVAAPSTPSRALGSSEVYEPCWEALETHYLNRPDVRQALHVNHNRSWASCDDSVFYHYDATSQAAPMEGYYLKLIRDYNYAALNMQPLKLLVFSGDDDAICGTHGTMSWIFALGLKVASYWQPWFFDDAMYGNRLAGYYTELDGLHFATVRGAGHEVPMFKPVEALQLFKDFLAISHTGLGGGIVGPNLMQSDDDDDDDKSAKTDDGDEDDDGNEGSSSEGSASDDSSAKCAESTQNTSAVAEAGVAGVFAGLVAGVLVCLAWFACCLPGRRQQEQEPPSLHGTPNSKGRNGNGTWRGSPRSGEGLAMGRMRGDGHSRRNRDSHGGSGGSSRSSSPVRPMNTKAGGFMRVDINERESEERDQVNPLVHATAAAAHTENENGDLAPRGAIRQEPHGYSPDHSLSDSARTFPEVPADAEGNDDRASVQRPFHFIAAS